jgi:hypothetical protein
MANPLFAVVYLNAPGFFPDISMDSNYLASQGRILMTIPFKRLALAALLGWSMQSPLLFAQSPFQAQPAQIVPVNMVVVEGAEFGREPGTNRPVHYMLNSHGMACASNFNNSGCGNFWSEFTFVFGSCRSFFGQTCTPQPSHFGAGSAGSAGSAYGAQKCCGN